MTDVNEAFRTERLSQIAFAQSAGERAAQSNEDRVREFDSRVADGKLRNLGNNRFQVTDPSSWDDGEVLVLRQIDVQGVMQRQILPEHGLDDSTGTVKVYSRAPMWHELGTVIPEGVSDIDTVMELGGLNYQVEKRPYLYRNPVTGVEETLDGQFTTYRMDTGKALGTVGNMYEPAQNRDSFEFLEKLVARTGVIWESAGPLRNGAKTFVSMRLPQEIRIDPNGVNDEILPFVIALNSHDGSGKFEVMVSPWRPICGNTERFAVRDALVRWGTRHTSNGDDKMREKILDAQHTMANSVKYFERFVEEENALAQVAMRDSDIDALINEIWGEVDEDATKQAITKRAKFAEKIRQGHAVNVEQVGSTLYAFERTVTAFADHEKTYKPRSSSLKGKDALIRATAVVEDLSGDLKSRAHRKLMLRVNR